MTVEGDAASAHISVRDTGIGIAPDVITRIFDVFVQGPDTQLAHKGGLGIGLTLVKRLVELHGGSVSATSAGVGQGSELVITLPLTTGEERASITALIPVVVERSTGNPSSIARIRACARCCGGPNAPNQPSFEGLKM